MNQDTKDIVVAVAVISVLVFSFLGGLTVIVQAYDQPPVVDPPSTANARSLEQPVYRFGTVTDDQQVYQDGTVLPTRTFSIEQWNSATNKWEVIGYTNTHLHKVKIDATDKLDISVGSTHRINPKT